MNILSEWMFIPLSWTCVILSGHRASAASSLYLKNPFPEGAGGMNWENSMNIYNKSESRSVMLTLCDPMDYTVHGIL